jgi:hypothetical protein
MADPGTSHSSPDIKNQQTNVIKVRIVVKSTNTTWFNSLVSQHLGHSKLTVFVFFLYRGGVAVHFVRDLP